MWRRRWYWAWSSGRRSCECGRIENCRLERELIDVADRSGRVELAEIEFGERRIPAEALGEVGIGEERFAVADCVGAAIRDRRITLIAIEAAVANQHAVKMTACDPGERLFFLDRKSTRLNSSH